MPNKQISIAPPVPGGSLDQTIYSASWMSALVNAALGRSHVELDPPGVHPILCKNPVQRATSGDTALPVELKAYSVVGIKGAVYEPSPTTEPRPFMQATLERAPLQGYVTHTLPAVDGQCWVIPFRPNEVVRVRVKMATPPTYQRKFIPGLPVGRLQGDSAISAGGGGFILMAPPFTQNGTDYFAYVMPDPVNKWEGFIVRQSGATGTTEPTGILTGRGTYFAGLIRPESTTIVADFDHNETTDWRGVVNPRDPAETYLDGTYVKLEWLNNEWQVYWSSCAPVTGLTGKLKEPA